MRNLITFPWSGDSDMSESLLRTSPLKPPFQMRWTRSSVDLLMLLLAVQRKLSMLTITKKTGQTKTIQITLFTARFTVHKTIEEWIRYHVHPNAVLLSIAKLRFQNTSWLHKNRIPAIRSWINYLQNVICCPAEVEFNVISSLLIFQMAAFGCQCQFCGDNHRREITLF